MDKNIIKKHLTVLKEETNLGVKPAGLSSTEKVQAQSKKTNVAAQKDVAKEMKDYDKPLKDDSEPVKYENSDEETEYHDEMEIMNGLEMNRYDRKPNEQFQKRAKEAIEGSSNMGNNPDWANVVTADQAGFTGPEFGKNLVKNVESSTLKRNAADIDNKFDNETTSISAKNSIEGKKKPAAKSTAISENKINKKEKMKRLVFKTEFKGVENALRVIPESYKVDGKEFHMTDGNEKYEIKWEGNLTEGRAIIHKASDKNLMTEDMAKMKHLMGYSSKETLGTVKGAARLDENARFNDVLNKTKGLISEMTGGMGFTGEGNLEGNAELKETEDLEEGCDEDEEIVEEGKVEETEEKTSGLAGGMGFTGELSETKKKVVTEYYDNDDDDTYTGFSDDDTPQSEYADVEIYDVKESTGEQVFKQQGVKAKNVQAKLGNQFNQLAEKHELNGVLYYDLQGVNTEYFALLVNILERQVGPDELEGWYAYDSWTINGKSYEEGDLDQGKWNTFVQELNSTINKEEVEQTYKLLEDLTHKVLIVHHGPGDIDAWVANEYLQGQRVTMAPIKRFGNNEDGDITTIYRIRRA